MIVVCVIEENALIIIMDTLQQKLDEFVFVSGEECCEFIQVTVAKRGYD